MFKFEIWISEPNFRKTDQVSTNSIDDIRCSGPVLKYILPCKLESSFFQRSLTPSRIDIELSDRVTAMYCALSGNVPKEPVISVKSGHLFERALIEKQLAISGNKCPETGESLSASDLLPVKNSGFIAPLPPEKSSMPYILDHVRAEWDRLTLELYTAQKLLHQTRQELATALYRCDASARVISKLEKERDELKASRKDAKGETERAHSSVNGSRKAEEPSKEQEKEKDEKAEEEKEDEIQPIPEVANDQSESDVVALPEGITSQAQKLAVELQETRRSRKSNAPKSNIVSSFAEIGRAAVDGPNVELSSVCVNGERTIVGSSNGKLHLIEKDMKVSHTEEAHSDSVTAVFWDERIFTGGRDGVVKVWGDDVKCKAMFDGRGVITDIERHPLKSVMYCCRADGYEWRDVEDGTVIARAKVASQCGAIHPDGLLFATGGANGVRMWDFSSLKKVADLQTERVTQIAMSEKGYYMVTVRAEEALVWDLRKQAVVGNVALKGGCGVALDEFGEYGCVVDADGINLFAAKRKAKALARVEAKGGSEARLGVDWGSQSSFVVVGGNDGVLRKYGASPS
ncbi:unnamed protein product [Agarophyton chilense]|eukprot:gb/GEZJ01000383.1/.p1 GENE.gb/GEZJ01000383.1/~~gb/GEZJ01000383.1/.p1  ORF type:complete len:573 (-),score=95.86 gb/GEZJ01000383.1/:3822-5540(-)